MSDFDHNNVHSVEFEAPLSSDDPLAAKRHFSIDLSLELERQLDMESFPPTPAHYLNGIHVQDGAAGPSPRDSLDPQILAHIVKQLQQNLSEVTRDRDELRESIVRSHSHEAELQDALQHMIDKATAMDVELTDARKKIKDDEDAIALLRTKVEESRRGLMRLQTENRRQSLAPINVTQGGLPSFNSPPSAKRGTFTPMTGTFMPMTGSVTARPGHRRIASVNDSPTNSVFIDKNPNTSFTFPDNNTTSLPPNSSRRYSGLFGRTSPSQPDAVALAPDHLTVELEALRKELRTVKDELEQTRHELAESNEAREASETCVKALREFIGENNVGATDADTASVTSLKLPPPPTMANGDDDDKVFQSKKTAPAASWGFGKLWGDATAKTTPNVPQSATIAPPHTTPSPPMPMSATPLSRKLGGFFSSRTPSISSSISTPAPPLHSNAASSFRESVYSTSDTSSVAEPVSPPEEYNNSVVVRDAANLSDSSAGNSPELGKEIQMRSSIRVEGIKVS